MKRNAIHILILALAVALCSLPLVAQTGSTGSSTSPTGEGQGRHHGMPSVDDQLQHLTKALNLSADQQAKIKPILVDAQKKMEDLRNDSSGDRQAMRQKMMQIRQDTNDQIRAQLDDKQKEKFDKQEQEREERMQNRRGGPSGPGGDNAGGNAPPPQN